MRRPWQIASAPAPEDPARRSSPSRVAGPYGGSPPAGGEVNQAARYADWDAIYEDNVRRIHRLMYAKVGNRPDAEDLTSQVFASAFRSLRATATIGEVRAYLLATARTVLATHWQHTLGRQVTVVDVDVSDLEDFCAPSEGQTHRRAEERAARILAGLPERYREILRLRFFLGHDVREAAAAMGITIANAKVLQHRALRKAATLDPDNAGAMS